MIIWLLLAMLTAVPGWTQEELAKKSQNPVANLISVPFENNTNFGVGPEDVNIGKMNLINRFILPVTYQEERIVGEGSEFGLGDFTYQAFFSPAEPSGVVWGAGPAFVFPTNTDDRLGVDKWSAGAAFVALAKPGPWLVGALVQNVWSYAGDDDAPDVNFFSFQYFVNYNFKSGWYLTSTPTMTADWEADSDDRWTVPVGGGIGKLVRFGKQPVDIKAQAFWNVEKPDGAADWTLQLQFKLLFPKSALSQND
jgi:hypothetical protein